MFIGIDVGEPAKGFHVALISGPGPSPDGLFQSKEAPAVVEYLSKHAASPQIIAIDAPPKSTRRRIETRAAEREVRSAGFRVLWTPPEEGQRQPWMENGARLWSLLKKAFPTAQIVEAFPTAASRGLALHASASLDLRLLTGHRVRKHYMDFLDAVLAALVAKTISEGRAGLFGPDDELGPIYALAAPRLRLTLVFVLRRDGQDVLLGEKKRGFGAGYWNGFGGKIEAGESVPQAARRELLEEAGIDCDDLRARGRLLFSFEGRQDLMDVTVFTGQNLIGQPRETDEMRPRWIKASAIDYDQMWPDDRYWLPRVLAGRDIEAYFHLDANHNILLHNIIDIGP